MKRIGNLLEKILSESNIKRAIKVVTSDSDVKKLSSTQRILSNQDEIVKRINREIMEGTYKLSKFREFTLLERGKLRTIQCASVYDRIVMNAVICPIDDAYIPKFIHSTAASIKGRGTHYLLKLFNKDAKKDPNGTRYAYKCDIRKFYQSIDQDLLCEIIRKKFKEPILVNILIMFATALKSGISIGFRPSQFFGNFFLDYYVDHKMKDLLGCKYYYRYCDDCMISASSYRELTGYVRKFKEFVSEANLSIKPNDVFFDSWKRPIDYLGFVSFSPDHIRIRKHIKQRFARRWKRVKSKKRKQQLIGAFYGITKHANAKRLFFKLTKIGMKKFSEFGFKYERKDGKKDFEAKMTSLTELSKEKIIVLDYETNIKTKNGDDRYLVYCENEKGEKYKFFTNSEIIKQSLDFAQANGGMPFETTIMPSRSSKNSYIFV